MKTNRITIILIVIVVIAMIFFVRGFINFNKSVMSQVDEMMLVEEMGDDEEIVEDNTKIISERNAYII